MPVKKPPRRPMNPARIDPTRTATLRRQLGQVINRNYAALKLKVYDLIVNEDALGLKIKQPTTFNELLDNTFCATGKGGKVDATCGKDGGAAQGPSTTDTNQPHTVLKGGGLFAKLKAVGGAVGHYEHVAKEYVADKIDEQMLKMPDSVASVLKGAYFLGKMGTMAAFATWSIGQNLAERVARERGATEEQAKALRGVLSAVDITAMKPIQIGLGASGLGALALPASMVPPATAGYLAYSTARNPMATIRAAGSMIADSAKALGHKLTTPTKSTVPNPTRLAKPNLMQFNESQYIVLNADPRVKELDDNVNIIADALESKKYNDWYIALLMAAVDKTDDIMTAIEVANKAYAKLPNVSHAHPQPDDAEAVLGPALKAQESEPVDEPITPDQLVEEPDQAQPQQQQISPQPVAQPDTTRRQVPVRQHTRFIAPKRPVGNILTSNQRWRFSDNRDKVRQFRLWLKQQINENINQRTDEQLWHRYVQTAYDKGTDRGFADTNKKANGKLKGVRDQLLESSKTTPDIVDKVNLLAHRAFTDLEGVNDAMSSAMARTLADGLVRGSTPEQIANAMVANVDGIGLKRALIIANNELVRAHAEGQLDSMARLGVESVGATVEWSALEGACKLCQPLDGLVLTIQEARGLIPRHVNCRCSWTPAVFSDDLNNQITTQRGIKQAVRASIKLSGSNDDWMGTNLSLADRRSIPNSGVQNACGPSVGTANSIQPLLPEIALEVSSRVPYGIDVIDRHLTKEQ